MLCIKSTIYLMGRANYNDRNSKIETFHDFMEKIPSVWVIGYWNLRFVCNLLARRLSGGVLVYCFL